MAIRDLDHLLRTLEDDAEDELSLLESTGPEFFTTPQLWRLRGQWEVKNRLFRQFHQVLVGIAAGSPAWIAGWALCAWIGWNSLALFLLFLFPTSFLIFIAGLLFMHRFFGGKGHLDRVGELIDEELRKRIGASASG